MCEHYPAPLHPRLSVPCERIVMYVMYISGTNRGLVS